MPAWGTFLISVWLEPHLTLHWMELVGWNFLYALSQRIEDVI